MNTLRFKLLPRHSLPVVALLLLAAATPPAWAQSNTFYRCVDASGATLYTNQKTAKGKCTVLSVMAPPPAASGKATGGSSATRTPTPTDFPRVGQGEQLARDSDRRSILEKELSNERNQLDGARKQLAEAQKLPTPPAPALKDAVALHERNIEALTKEMAKLP